VETVIDSERSCLIFQSRSAGCHIGRMHAMLFSSERVRNQWAAYLKRAMARARHDKAMLKGTILSWQQPVHEFYNHAYVQSKCVNLGAAYASHNSMSARHSVSTLPTRAAGHGAGVGDAEGVAWWQR
jgi:hypothetical protein